MMYIFSENFANALFKTFANIFEYYMNKNQQFTETF